jgi:ribosomal protein S20
MDGRTRRMVVAGVAALALVAGGSAAFAVSQRSNSPSAERQAFIKDVAGRLGVKQSALQSAFRQAAIDRVDAAVKAGMLTKQQGDAIKARIRSGNFGPGAFGGARGGMHGHFEAVLKAAADYIGITQQQLLDQLRAGKSAADVAKAHDKTVAGLKTAVLGAAEKQLDQDVSDGKLTRTQADDILSRLKSNIDDLVNRAGLPGPPDGGPGWHDGGGPPMGMAGPPGGGTGSGGPSFNGPPAGFGAPA